MAKKGFLCQGVFQIHVRIHASELTNLPIVGAERYFPSWGATGAEEGEAAAPSKRSRSRSSRREKMCLELLD